MLLYVVESRYQHVIEYLRAAMREHDMPSAWEHRSSSDDLSNELGAPAVLIVDDEPIILELIRDVLEDAGFTVLTANTGTAALYLVQHTPVALILTDLMMPNLSGIELARRLRGHPNTAAIPLVLMSAAMPDQVSDLFVAVIHKPFPIDTVVETVRRYAST
jgi:CheY-like chemotaxis protein